MEIGLTPVIRNGVPAYSESYDTALAPQFYTGDMSYGRLEPQKEIAIVQSDYRAGFGHEYLESDNHYFYGINADLRHKDMAILGPLTANIDKITLPTCIDTELDVWTDANTLTNWTKAGTATLTRQGTPASGTYCAEITGTNGQTLTLTQTLGNWSDNFRNKLVSISATIRATAGSNGGTFTVSINDGIGTTASASVTCDNSWYKVVVSRTLDASATKIDIILTATSVNPGSMDAFFDLITVATYGAVTSQCDFGGSHYIASGGALIKLTSSNSLSVAAMFPYNITQIYPSMVSGTDYLFICLGWGSTSETAKGYWYMTTGEVCVQSTLTSNTLAFFAVSGATFYGSDSNSTIVSTTAPLNGGTNWGTSKQIGEDTYDIVSLVTYAGLIYAKKTDCKVYYINSSGTVTILINGQVNLGGTNTSQMYVWREDALIIPYGIQGLLHYNGTNITHIEPTLYSQGVSDFVGQIQAVAGDDQWLYIAVDNSTKVEIMAVQYSTVGDDTGWHWHTLNELTLTNCKSLSMSSVYKKRLWVGSDTGSEAIYYIPVTTVYGSIISDTNYTYQTGGYFITSWHHYNIKGDTKAWIKLTLKMSGTTSAIYWRAYYETFGDTDWTEISPTPTFFKTSPSTSAYIPVDSGSNKPVSNMIRFKFEGVTGTNTISPVLLTYDVRGIWYPTEKKMISLQVRVKDNLPNEQGQMDDQLGSTIRSTLDNLNSSSWPRAFYPPYWESASDTIYVKKLPLPEGRRPLQMVQNERDKTSEWVYELNLEVVTLS